MSDIKTSKFNIGDIVTHQRQGYRAVIIDIDPIFRASGLFNPQATKRPFAHQNPWYRLLVDETNQETYVEEPLLTLDPNQMLINNPQVEYHLVLKENKYAIISHRH